MKKVLKVFVSIFLVLGLCILTGCNNKESDFSGYKVKSKGNNIVITANNVKKDKIKNETISISKGNKITIKINLETSSGVNVKLHELGNEDSEEPIIEDDMYYESEISTSGLIEGKYSLILTSLDDGLTGTVEIVLE